MAAVDDLIPPNLDGNREILFGDETTRAGPDAAPTSNAQALIGLDHGVEFVSSVHALFPGPRSVAYGKTPARRTARRGHPLRMLC